MENTARPITSEQRRMLSKLYEKKVAERISKARQERSDKEDKLEKQIIKAEYKELVDLVEQWNKLDVACKKTRELLEEKTRQEAHVSFSSYGNDPLILNGSHPEVKKFNEASIDLWAKMEEARDKILTNIWGLDASYGELVKMIDEEFGAIGV